MNRDERSTDTPAVFVFERLNEICTGDSEFERELLGEFLHGSPVLLARARAAIAAADASELEQAAHSLKGSARTLGADALGAALFALETMGRNGDLSPASPGLERAEAEFERVRTLLEEHLRKSAA
jgi:HPt (histidine-containing phosphotransfer) domain-containing protein